MQSARTDGADSGKCRPKIHRLLIPNQWRLHKEDGVIDSVMTSWSKWSILSLSFTYSSHIYENVHMQLSNTKMNKKKEQIWEVPTYKKVWGISACCHFTFLVFWGGVQNNFLRINSYSKELVDGWTLRSLHINPNPHCI